MTKTKTDEELIKVIETAPNSAAAMMAKEILEYRKYMALKRQNVGILWLTIVLTLSAIVQATMAAVEVLGNGDRSSPISVSNDCSEAVVPKKVPDPTSTLSDRRKEAFREDEGVTSAAAEGKGASVGRAGGGSR